MTTTHPDIPATLEAVRRRSASAVTETTLTALTSAPPGVLIGPPLHDQARADAARVDASPHHLPLRGVPFVVKDNIDVAGVPTTAACPGFTYISGTDAAVVAALRSAGAIVVGKANLDQFATGLVGTRSPYGTPPNTLDPDLVPGGSSSGSAAAVALGLVPFSIGTDTAGSGRVPASLNGIVGFKPTVGRYDTTGLVPAIRRFDCPSVFAHTIADTRLVAAAMRPRPAPDKAPADMPTRPAIAVVGAWPTPVDVDPAIDAAYRQAVERLERCGAVLVPTDIQPMLRLGRMLYGSALVAERTLTAGDAIRRGVDGLDPTVTAIISNGWQFTAEDAYRTEYELAHRCAVAHACLHDVDAIALPTTPFVPTIAAVSADPTGTNERLGTFTTFANLLGMPGIVVPLPGPVPCGLQLLASPWADEQLTHLAELTQRPTLSERSSSWRRSPATEDKRCE